MELGDKLAVLEAARDEKDKKLDGHIGSTIDKSNLAYNLLARVNPNEMPDLDTISIKGKNLETEATTWANIDPKTKEINHDTKHSFISTKRRANMFYSPVNTLFSSLTELMFNGDNKIPEKENKRNSF